MMRGTVWKCNEPYALADSQARLFFANEAFEALTGWAPGKKSPLGYSGDGLALRQAALDVLSNGFVWRHEIQTNKLTPGCSERWVELTMMQMPVDEANAEQEVAFLLLATDISWRKLHERVLQESHSQLQSLLEMSMDWYWEQDKDLRFTTFSKGISKTGQDYRKYIGKTRHELHGQPNDPNWLRHQQVLDARISFRDFEYKTPDKRNPGAWRWFSTTGEPIFNAKGCFSGYRGVGRDITEKRQQNEAMWRLANLDQLTGLPNRIMFGDQIDQDALRANSENRPFALLLINIDNFSAINTTLGHRRADQLLQQLAAAFKNRMQADDFLARTGPDEFGAILPGIHRQEDLSMRFEGIRQVGAEVFETAGAHSGTLRFGATFCPADGKSGSELMKNADIALGKARECGNGQLAFYQAKDLEEMTSRRRLFDEFSAALTKRQVVFHYQPVVDLETNTVLTFEALMRWNHPERGLLAPGQFMEVFTSHDLCARMGVYVCDEVMNQMARWRTRGLDGFKVAINVTLADFTHNDLPALIKTRSAEHGILLQDICLEVTEGMVLDDKDEMIRSGIRALSDMGVELACDDFGTGYASLIHLTLPFTRIKIDKSFVNDIASNRDHRSIVEAICDLGRSLGKQITVEGIETVAQQEILQAFGCTKLQGYLYSRPMPAEAVPDFIARFGSGAHTHVGEYAK